MYTILYRAIQVESFVHALVAVAVGLKPALLFEAAVLEAEELLEVCNTMPRIPIMRIMHAPAPITQ